MSGRDDANGAFKARAVPQAVLHVDDDGVSLG